MLLHHYIGTSGWHYEHWRGRFYPEKLAKAKWLEFYTGHFTTVELNFGNLAGQRNGALIILVFGGFVFY